jgi:hypothetical protein
MWIILLYGKLDVGVTYNYTACLARGKYLIENCLELFSRNG